MAKRRSTTRLLLTDHSVASDHARQLLEKTGVEFTERKSPEDFRPDTDLVLPALTCKSYGLAMGLEQIQFVTDHEIPRLGC